MKLQRVSSSILFATIVLSGAASASQVSPPLTLDGFRKAGGVHVSSEFDLTDAVHECEVPRVLKIGQRDQLVSLCAYKGERSFETLLVERIEESDETATFLVVNFDDFYFVMGAEDVVSDTWEDLIKMSNEEFEALFGQAHGEG